MSRFFIHRPIFAIVIALCITILDLISAVQLPIAQYPQISPPTVSVSTTYTGANASVVNQTIAQIIEEQVNGTQGMDYMSSNSDDTGSYRLQVVFELGTDSDMDSVKVQNNVAVANASLPSDVQNNGVTTKKASSSMALTGALYSPDGTYDRTFLKNYADIYIIDKIKRIKGVGDVSIYGSDFSMRVWLNPDKLAELGLTVADVTSAIKEQNIQAPAGTIGQLPAPKSQEKQYTGNVQGRLSTPEEFGNVIVKANANGSFVRLKDISRIETGGRKNDVYSEANGVPGVSFGVQLTSDANAMETVAEVRQVLEECAQDFPPDLQYKEIVDSTKYISESIREVTLTFFEALLLVMLIVFIFLQSWRATLIPMLAVPVSLIGTFTAFQLLGFSINTLTLFAMVLAIGLVVDDAIVVIENVEHHMRDEGLSPTDAAERAMEEVQGPVVAIACVLAAVFVPVAFLGGMMGVLYKQFALTIAISMALSAFIALTLTPALCAMLLRPKKTGEKEGRLDRWFAHFNQWFERTRSRYTGIVGWLMGKAKYCTAFLLVVVGLTGLLYAALPMTFVPAEDQGYFITTVTLPEGTSLNRTEDVVKRLADEVQNNPGVKNIMTVVGRDMLSNGAKSNAGALFVSMNPWEERKTADTQIDAAIRRATGQGQQTIPEASVVSMNPPALPGLGMIGGFTMQLQDMSGHTDAELDQIARQIVAAARQRPELQGVRTTYNISSPTYDFEIDREKVKNLNVSLSDVFTALQVNFGGASVNDFNRFGRTYKVVVQSDMGYRSEADNMKFTFVKNSAGTMVPLDTLLKPKRNTAPSIISRFNDARSLTFQGNAASGYSSGQAIQAMEEVTHQIVPTGFNIEWSGQSRQEKTAGSSTMKVLALALVFVFLSLAALYESWSVPYAVLLTVPTGIFGALLAEYTMRVLESALGGYNDGLQNSIYMQIGIIMIIGLAAKNAILIVEFAKVRVDQGIEPVKAAIEAARLRLRPILMTSLAFIIGCLPLAAATGAGAAARNGMGVAVVGGMLFATSMGIFLIPVFFVIVEAFTAKFGFLRRIRRKKPENYM